jgi:endo-1,4-beta-xylanase
MHQGISHIFIRFYCLFLAIACMSALPHNRSINYPPCGDSTKCLKDYYKDYFPIGVAVSPRDLGGREADLLVKHFNSVTPENAMKMGPIHPIENSFHWKVADSIVNFALQHGMRIRGHNLCWHEQTPPWLFVDGGREVSKEVLLKRLYNHIDSVVGRYKGKIYAWDVVNEAVSDSPSTLLRNSAWYRTCGMDFIKKAFEYAHEADPHAVLFYNDYNTERPDKRDRIYQLLKNLLDAGVPVEGIGLQGHWSIYDPSREELEKTLQQFVSLGLQIQITELDISVYPWEKNRRERRTSDTLQLDPALAEKQAAQYRMVFELFRKYRKYITGVTFWNLSDKHTWLDSYPVAGRKNYPLLFDTALAPKQAYCAVIQFDSTAQLPAKK